MDLKAEGTRNIGGTEALERQSVRHNGGGLASRSAPPLVHLPPSTLPVLDSDDTLENSTAELYGMAEALEGHGVRHNG